MFKRLKEFLKRLKYRMPFSPNYIKPGTFYYQKDKQIVNKFSAEYKRALLSYVQQINTFKRAGHEKQMEDKVRCGAAR